MRRLSSIILLIFLVQGLWGQKSPHGEDFLLGCDGCHNPASWKIDFKTLTFNHGATSFPLEGQHREIGCRECHQSLTFKKAGKECIDCHTDMHNQTVGPDCKRCHTPVSWVVNDITGMHQRSRFPLVGAHQTADCYDCHTNAASDFLNFAPLGTLCNDCHNTDYTSAKNPDHVKGNFSTDCSLCHSIYSYSWSGAGFSHQFFPLTQGHEISDCSRCHKSPDYSSTSPVCASCHQTNYNGTTNPNHSTLGFSTNCTDCHTTNPGWKPAQYRDHDSKSFPIYSGTHNGEWNSCGDCHPNPASYAQFTCIDCHEHNQSDMDEEHQGVSGYAWNSPACLGCHPNGEKEGFDHSQVYPLTGAHTSAECIKCHASGYQGTPNTCAGCHQGNYNQSLNPNHSALGLSTNCQDCHTTQPGWEPATFSVHNNYYVLAGAHALIATNCNECHNGNYTSTPNTCVGCHQAEYNQTTNPPHASAQFPTSCEDCHSQTAWSPANWDHDGQYFPIYSGKHKGEWNSCADCHTNPGNYALFSCIDCHEHNKSDMDNEHSDVQGYAYNSIACFNCHPQGSGDRLIRNNLRHE